jgi:hypothetical protein
MSDPNLIDSERQSFERMWDPSSRVNTAIHHVLTGEDPRLRKGRRFREMLPGRDRCKNCRAPFDGPAGWLMRFRGRGQYDRNPKFCNF